MSYQQDRPTDPSNVWAHELEKRGGAWLSAMRSWIQSHHQRGEYVIWGSDERLTFTVRELEAMAARAAAAAINEDRRRRK